MFKISSNFNPIIFDLLYTKKNELNRAKKRNYYINTGKRKILKIIEGPISQQKYDWLVNYHNTMLEQVNNGNYNTKNKSKNTFSGYVFGDEQISNNLLEDYEYTINYHSSIKNKITILDENIKKTQNSKWKKENIMLKKRLKNRNLSYYYDYTLINNFMNQDFQYLLSLIFCIILVIKLFIYEKQKQTDLYFYISRKQIKKIFRVMQYNEKGGIPVQQAGTRWQSISKKKRNDLSPS